MEQSSALIIGAGFSGITAAVKLRQAGVTDFVILERGLGVGGTWRDAVYPGAEVDVPAYLYSLSFAPNPDWSAMNAPAPEILSYIEDIVERFDLAAHFRFGADVTRAEFDAATGSWLVTTQDGREFTTRALIAADGPLSEPRHPDIPGIDSFAGQTMLSAHWDTEYDFTDKRVAVVGTGSSSVQIVPELVKTAGNVAVFQRSAAYVIPRTNFTIPDPAKRLFRRFPRIQQAVRTALFLLYEVLTYALVWITPLTTIAETVSRIHLRTQVKDPVLRRQLKPEYRIGCKRPLITSQFYPALQKPNAQLVPHGVVEVTERGVRSADGVEHEVDCIVFATGYDVGGRGTRFPIIGLDGRKLGDEWSRGMSGYKSVNVAGYPNLFWMLGPNSFGHSSLLLFAEEQANSAVRGVKKILDDDLLILDVKPEAQAAHHEQTQRSLAKTTLSSGCDSWYLKDGYNGVLFPGTVLAFRRQMTTFDVRDYTVVKAVVAQAPTKTA